MQKSECLSQVPTPLQNNLWTDPGQQELHCAHCGDRLPPARLLSFQSSEQSLPFCCLGCSVVYSLLSENGLEKKFYQLRGNQKSPSLKNKDFLSKGSQEAWVSLDFEPSLQQDFFIEGIHCTACVWILERLSELSDEVKASRLDLGRSILRVVRHESGGFSRIARLIDQLGYSPHAIRTSQEGEKHMHIQDQRTLRRIGLAAFSALNVMSYSFALYLGVDGTLAVWFRIASLVVSLPALTYSAFPFYRNAFSALRSRRISMDLPITLALFLGFFESVRQVILGTNLLYLDSITMLVALLLLSRYFLQRLERSESSKAGLLHSLLPHAVKTVDGVIRIDSLQKGSQVEVDSGDTIPADGWIQSGSVLVNESFLTGESRSLLKSHGDFLYAGSQVFQGQAVFQVSALQEETRLGKMSSKMDSFALPSSSQSLSSYRIDRWATVFLSAVMGFSFLMIFLFGTSDWEEALKRSLSLLVIACPCALALATPLTLSRGYQLAAKAGVLLRDPAVLGQKLASMRIVFDKTGTLTCGRPTVQKMQWVENFSKEQKTLYSSLIYTMELGSTHPFASSLVEKLENQEGVRELHLENLSEIPGQGMSAMYHDRSYFVGRKRNETSPGHFIQAGFWEEDRLVVSFEFEDSIRDGARETIAQLQKEGHGITLLSGDSPDAVFRVAQELGIRDARGGLFPEEKMEVIAQIQSRQDEDQKVLMVGDGVNDLPALRKADLGVVINRWSGGGIQSVLEKVSIVFLKPKLSLLLFYKKLTQKYQFTMRRNLGISLIYNSVGAVLAVSGMIHPLVAAVLMPLSAMTVFASTAIGMRVSEKREEMVL